MGELAVRGEVMPEGQLTLFELAHIVNREHELAREAGLAMVEHAIRAGEALIAAKAQLHHGEWLPWLADEFDGSERMAQRYMTVAANPTRVSDLDEPSLRKALEAIASDGRRERDARLAEERACAEAEARATIARLGAQAHRVEIADVHSWRPQGASCIVTDPPYITADAVELHSALADLALDVLPPHGALVVMTWQPILAAVMDAMRRDRLVYRWAAAWTFETPQRTPDRARRVFDGWKPVLVFHKDGWTDETTYLYDVVRSADADKASHEWGQGIEGFRQLVRAVSRAGDTVCDPFVGGGTTAIAALAEARLFVGCDRSPEAVRITNARLAA